jgi:hypothetical protein
MLSSEFKREYSKDPKFFKLKMLDCADELGTSRISGIPLVMDPTEDPNNFRQVVLWSETMQYSKENILTPDQQLREDEPGETYSRLNRSKAEQFPPER